ncbi:MAG: hypothetical protein LUF32_00640 [Clostridiales bacterium]|nr:hypothetical protein [Clostridiales bacterium]
MTDIKIRVFFTAVLVFAVIGILIPLRPSESALEKRTLEKFPSFTIASFLDGSFFSEISTWYADSFPFREKMLAANAGFENLYGIQEEQIVSAGNQEGDEIPEAYVEPSFEEEPPADAPEEADPDGTIYDEPEVSGDVYISGDTAFSIFYFNTEGANAYIQMIDNAQKKLDGIADVYTILVPTTIGINLSEEMQEQLNSANQKDAIDYIYSGINQINSKIKTVEIFDALKSHNSEYIYFRTDHHWTALGAYYAYVEFCDVKGIDATPVEEYETMEFTDFLGSFYSSSNQAASLRDNPDTVIAYIPKSTNNMVFCNTDGIEYEWNVIYDVSSWESSAKYSTFAAGDNYFGQIYNPTLSDGSACVVIKESFGNAFIPFLVDHYEYVYIVDYRYFHNYYLYDNSVCALVEDKGITDVIFINNVEAMDSKNKVSLMDALFADTEDSAAE